jgi:hypothetical protein
MTWYSGLVIWWQHITFQRANNAGNLNDFAETIINQTRNQRHELTKLNVKGAIHDIELISEKLHEIEKDVNIINQDQRIFENLKKRKT